MALDQVGRQSSRTRAAGASNARAVGEEEAIGHDFVVGERLEEILVVVPTHAGAASAHEPGPAQDEAPRADPEEGYPGFGDLPQITGSGLVDLRARVERLEEKV